MKKMHKAVVSVLCIAVGACALAACGNNDDNKNKDTQYTVTYYDATGKTTTSEMPVLKTEKVDKGTKLTAYTPTKEGGYEFVDWFATPSKSYSFDFSTEITANTNIFAGFTKYQADTRTYYVVGSGTSELLFASDWGKTITDDHKLTKAADKNEYTITMDVKSGDQFQFVIDSTWANQRGVGYMRKFDENGTTMFSGQGSVYSESLKTSNIKCEYDGNYTFTLKTYPGDDYYNTAGNGYTEDRKEIYNMGTYDRIEWVRNGDVVNNSITVTDFFIKGASITDWKDMRNADTMMTRNGNKYTMSVYLKEGDQFMFASRVTKIENGETTYTSGSEYIKSNLLDAAGQQLVGGYTESGGNMTAKASGTYTFEYDGAATTLKVTFEAGTPTALDYYVDGTAINDWGAFVSAPADYKLVETSAGSGVYEGTFTLKAGKEFQIRACTAGETPTQANTASKLYQYNHLASNAAFTAMSDDNNNIKVGTAGEYVISFDSYSKIITITANSPDKFDVYLKGLKVTNSAQTESTWSHNFADEWRMTYNADANTYEITVTVEAGAEFGLEKFGKGASEGYGTFINTTKLGTGGDGNSNFGTDGNFKATAAGKYKIVYSVANDTVDFYAVAE